MQNQQTEGADQCSKDITHMQKQRPSSPTVTITWYASKYKVHKLYQSLYSLIEILLKLMCLNI